MGTTAFIDLNFGYAAGAAMRISGMGGGSSARTAGRRLSVFKLTSASMFELR
jgi:hypothetical protein